MRQQRGLRSHRWHIAATVWLILHSLGGPALSVPPVVILEGGAASITGTDRDQDGVLESSYETTVRIPCTNHPLSLSRAYRVTAQVTMLTSGLDVLSGVASYGEVGVGQTALPLDGGFRLYVNPSVSGEVRLSVTFSYTDADGATTYTLPEPLEYRFTVEPRINQPPTLTLPDVILEEDAARPQAVDLWAVSTDSDTPAASLSFQLIGVSATEAGVSLEENRYLSVVPRANWFGSIQVTFQVGDPEGLTTLDTMMVTVISINDPPVMAAIPDQVLDENTTRSRAVDLWSVGTDVETAVEKLAFSLVRTSAPEAGVTLEANRYLSIAPHADWFGSSTVSMQVADPEGLTATTVFEVIVQRMNTPPATTLEIGEPRWVEAPVYVTSATALTLRATDDTGVAYTEYRLDGGAWLRVIGLLTLTEEGLHLLSYRSVDLDGAIETSLSLAVFVDTTPPQTVLHRSDERFVLRASDGGVGVEATYASIDTAPPQVITEPISLADGLLLRYWSVDHLGNTEATQTYLHQPQLQDPFLEVIPTPRPMPLIRLTGRSASPSVQVEVVDPAAQTERFTIPVSPASRLSQHMMLSGAPGNYLLNAATAPQPPGTVPSLPIEVALQPADFLLDATRPLTLADLDQDGDEELLAVGMDGRLHAWQDDGRALNGWPVQVGEPLSHPVAVADLDGDGVVEVVGCTESGRVIVWSATGIQRWAISTGSPGFLPPVLIRRTQDASSSYGVVVGSGDGQVFFWDANGQPMTGWPVRLTTEPIVGMAAGDLDRDGPEEMVAAWGSQVTALALDGTARVGWPVTAPAPITAGPVIGPLTNSGQLEVFVGMVNGAAMGWTANGAPLAGWPVIGEGTIQELALGDLDGSNRLELLGTTRQKIFAWAGDGTAVIGWPIQAPFPQPLEGVRLVVPSLPETVVVASAHNGQWKAWQGTGQAATVPQLNGIWAVAQAPTLGDLDHDGDLDWISLARNAGTAHLVIGDDSRAVGASPIGWPQFAHDSRHTGHHPAINQAPALSAIGNRSVNEGQTLAFTLSASDPNGDPLTYSGSPLPSGASLDAATGNFTWTPGFQQAGSYPVAFIVSDGELSDSETITITVVNVPRPDLIVSALSTTAPPTAPGSSFSLANTVRNQGTVSAEAFTVAFHLSVDPTYGGEDDIPFITSRSIASLGVGASSSASTTLTIPATTPLGTYYVCASADPTNAVTEENEANGTRCTASPIQVVLADLIMTAVTGPTSAVRGSLISITTGVKNQGTGTSGSFYIGLYLSRDPIITTTDLRLGSRYVSSLGAGVSYAAATTVTIPSTLAPGTYFLGAIADYTNRVPEGTNESNNALTGGPIAITVINTDLIITNVSGPLNGVRGSPIRITTGVKNQGTGTSGSFYIGLYLSRDPTITTADLRLGSRYVGTLAAGAISYAAATTVTIPSTLAPGTYFLGAIADYTKQAPETNETNNALSGNSITIP